MRLRRERPAPRTGFTIIELLVVILIIVVLMGLLLPAVQRVMITLEDAKVSTEISQIAQGTEAFRTKHGDYPPSRIRLIEQPTGAVYYDPSNAFDMYSVEMLRRFFPAIYITVGPASGSNPPHTHNWNGSTDAMGNPTVEPGAAGNVILEGEECLVFFLGGIPAIDSAGVYNGSGFCTDMTNPTLPTPNRNRNGPYFEFKSERLSLTINPTGRSNNRFPVYRDHYLTPYLYFRARYGTENNYPCNAVSGTIGPPNATDCNALLDLPVYGSQNFSPYCKADRRLVGSTYYYSFHQTDKFQIVSAGRDRIYGDGALYRPQEPDALGPYDKDNLTNLAKGKLGG